MDLIPLFDEENPNIDVLVLADQTHYSPRPEIVLFVEGRPMLFLVDTGAEKTVIRDTKGLPPSSKFIRVLSANGRVTRNTMTKLITLKLNEDDLDEQGVQLNAVLSPMCPHNLLGRDAILGLQLTLSPGLDGRLMVNPPGSEIYVVEGQGLPHYYWTLDFPKRDITNAAESLCKIALNYVSPKKNNTMSPGDLHMTLRYKLSPGPDPTYDCMVQRLGPQVVTLTHLYFKDQTSFCDLDLPYKVTAMMPKSADRHISVTKTTDQEWRDLGPLARSTRFIKDWKPTGKIMNEEHSPSTGWSRIKLTWRATLVPDTHMTDF